MEIQKRTVETESEKKQDLEQLNVLIVENSESDALIIGELLSMSDDYSYEIYHVVSLSDAEEILEVTKIDIILVNLFLPDSFGIHTFNDLFRAFPNIPFIILTEMEDDVVGKNAVQKGAQDFLVKSDIDKDTLNRSIAYAIERKHTEEQLRKSEERYRELFIRSNDAIYISTIEGAFIDINPAGLKLFGYDTDDMDYISVKDLYVDDVDRDQLMKFLAKEGEVSDYEVDLLKKDGRTILHCLLSTIVIRNSLGNIIGYQGIIKDITEKKKAEEALIKSLRDLDRANKELQTLNLTLEQKVNERTKQLVLEKETVINQHKEITESINYAKRIQASILPGLNKIQEQLPGSFIYYAPKDIVSGDFYWYEYSRKKALFAVVDCTGHGVPGAFMSIIGYTQLNEIISDQKITDPGVILKELDKRVRTALNQNAISDFSSKDGMELGLISVNFEQQKIEFSGAMRPLYFVKEGDLHIIKGDKYSIGGESRHKKNFKTHRISFDRGDCFYLFSDGYPDQFGGPKGKKFMTRNVGEMVKSMAHLPIKEQGSIVKNAMLNWMRDEEQVDDILIAGIKF
ncbi:MAG: PAS domain S-box protein [Vicingaceae bacterium]